MSMRRLRQRLSAFYAVQSPEDPFTLIKNLLLLALLTCSAFAQQAKPEHQLAYDILNELVEVNTTSDTGSTRKTAELLQKRFLAAGFAKEDVTIFNAPDNPTGPHANLVVRLRGSNPAAKPVLLMAHMDVVPALRSDWSTDPYQMVEKDGEVFGRGTDDNKSGVAVIAANLLRLKKEGYVPKRDLYAFFTRDEETNGQGIQELLNEVPGAKNAAYALNADGGGGLIVKGKKVLYSIQTSEKVYADYELKAIDKGGHSSRPRDDANPIYRLAAALIKLRNSPMPVNLNDTTRAMLRATAQMESGQFAADLKAAADGTADAAAMERLSKNPSSNIMLRTTCVATMVSAGHAPNALPQTATANVNCRILPNDDVLKIGDLIRRVIADPSITVTTVTEPKPSPPSPVNSDAYRMIEGIAKQMWPGVMVVPGMSSGATDGLYVRNAGVPVYGAMGLFGEMGSGNAHGRDENINVASFYESVDQWYTMLKRASE
jgi:acetylornithine deacetylase/succinyl-diaminopimelate desuccinylase-like protein